MSSLHPPQRSTCDSPIFHDAIVRTPRSIRSRYFLGTYDQYQALANALHPIENLTLKERYSISMAPVNSR